MSLPELRAFIIIFLSPAGPVISTQRLVSSGTIDGPVCKIEVTNKTNAKMQLENPSILPFQDLSLRIHSVSSLRDAGLEAALFLLARSW